MAEDIPNLLSEVAEGFVNLAFGITEWVRTPEGELSVMAKALSEGRTDGLRIVIGYSWNPANLGDSIPVFWGTVSYVSIGAESDLLIQAIAAAYRLAERPATMVERITFVAIALEGNPSNCLAEALRMKLFHESDSQEGYAEVYTSIDVYRAQAAIREKDPEYRYPLLAAIARPKFM